MPSGHDGDFVFKKYSTSLSLVCRIVINRPSWRIWAWTTCLRTSVWFKVRLHSRTFAVGYLEPCWGALAAVFPAAQPQCVWASGLVGFQDVLVDSRIRGSIKVSQWFWSSKPAPAVVWQCLKVPHCSVCGSHRGVPESQSLRNASANHQWLSRRVGHKTLLSELFQLHFRQVLFSLTEAHYNMTYKPPGSVSRTHGLVILR